MFIGESINALTKESFMEFNELFNLLRKYREVGVSIKDDSEDGFIIQSLSEYNDYVELYGKDNLEFYHV